MPSCSGAIFQLDGIIMLSFPQCPRAVDESHRSGGGRERVRENKRRLVCQIPLIISLINFNNSPIALLLLAFTYWLFVHNNKLWPFRAQNGTNWKEQAVWCLPGWKYYCFIRITAKRLSSTTNKFNETK